MKLISIKSFKVNKHLLQGKQNIKLQIVINYKFKKINNNKDIITLVYLLFLVNYDDN